MIIYFLMLCVLGQSSKEDPFSKTLNPVSQYINSAVI